ncbi:hypothetical protein FBQ87_05570 [Sphingobacteriales bacterium CHB3]|nr:hypothetical protein [Sphingobacteriales bacterium CHB3]
MTRRHILITSVFIFVATMMTFVNAVNSDFVNWDDDAYIVKNPHIRQLDGTTVSWAFSNSYFYSWIPLTLLSHATDVALWGLNPKGHHFTGVLLHSFNATWIFLAGVLLFRLGESASKHSAYVMRGGFTAAMLLGSGVCALLFAMHPLRVESVAWVSGRKELLCTFFLVPAFASYFFWRFRRRERWLVATYILFALALLSKPVAVMFPFVLVIVDAWWLKRGETKSALFGYFVEGKILMMLMSAAVVLINMSGPRGVAGNVFGEIGIVERLLFFPYAVLFYVWKMLAPFDLSPVYPELNRTLLLLSPLVLVAAGYALFALKAKRRTGLATAFLAYIVFIAPTFVGVPTGLQPLADRYTYLSTIPLFLFVGGCGEWWWRRSSSSPGKLYQREALFVLLFILCGINAYRTVRHVSIWHNSVSLWSQAVRYAPSSRNEFEARKPYLKPDYLDALTMLGTAYYDSQNPEKAADAFRMIVLLDSCNAEGYHRLGYIQAGQGLIDSSKASFKKAIACNVRHAKAHFDLGMLLTQQDSLSAALPSLRTSARLGFHDAQEFLRVRGIEW